MFVFTSIFKVSIAFHHRHNSLFLSFVASLDAISVSVCCHGNGTDIMWNLLSRIVRCRGWGRG